MQVRRGFNQIAEALRSAGLEVEIIRPAKGGDDGDDASEDQADLIPFSTATAQTTTQPTAVMHVPVVASAPQIPAHVDPSALVFVEEEGDHSVAIFQAGTVRYSVTMREDGITKRRVVIRANGKSCTHDLDLAIAAARERTAGGAARQVGLPPATISAHLQQILAMVQAREEARLQAPAVAVSADERTSGIEFLAVPDLLDRVVADLTTLGWIGENQTKRLLFLVAISRLLPQPLWAVYRSTGGAAPWQALACISTLTPPETRTQHHRVTDAALVQSDPAALRHHLLVVDQAETIRPEAAVTLRILKERGGVGIGTGEARGPVAVLAAAAGDIDHRCRDCFMTVTVDDSAEQTALIMAAQCKQLTLPAASVTTQAAIAARHHAAQRLLDRLPVAIPFADRIAFPAASPRHRTEHANFLRLIQASALLHQRQRQLAEGAIVATVQDFDIAVGCTAGLLGQEIKNISTSAQRLLSALFEHKLTSFTMADVGGLFPDWSRFAFRAAIQDLCDFGHVEAGPKNTGGRGKLSGFRLLGTASPVTGIHLRPADSDTHNEIASAKLAETGWISKASLSPVRTGT